MSSLLTKTNATITESIQEGDKNDSKANSDKAMEKKDQDADKQGRPLLDTLAMGFDRAVKLTEEDVYRIFLGKRCKNIKEISWTMTKNIALIVSFYHETSNNKILM